MAIDPNAYLDKKHTGWFTGKEGNKGYAYWDPKSGSYIRQTEADYLAQRDAYVKPEGQRTDNMLTNYVNKYGDYVSGLRPENTYKGSVNGEQVSFAGVNPEAGKFLQNGNGTPVPGTATLNPDYVEKPKFLEDTQGPKISYGQHGQTPAERQGLFNQAFANNPELAQSPEFAQALENSGLLTSMEPQAPQMSGQEAFDFASDYANRFHAGKGDAEQHQANMDEAREFSKDSSLLQSLSDHAIETKTGVQEFLNTARSLHMYNPEAFEEWELKNPEMALRYHARAAAGNGQVGGIEGYDHAGRAQALSYGISQQLGYGEDGKKDGKAIAYNFDTFNDLQSENGDGDFWKLGTPNTFTNDLSDYLEDNPLEVAGMVALAVFAPQIVGAMGLSGISAGVASGALTAVGNGIITGNTDDLLMSAVKGGLTGGLGAWATGAEGILVTDFGFNESVANIATAAVGDAVINGTDPVQALITAAGAEGVTLALGAAKDALGDMFSTDEIKVEVGADGTSTGTINQETLDELDFLSKNPDALQEIDLGTIPSQRPPNPLGTPNIPRNDALQEIDLGTIPSQRPPNPLGTPNIPRNDGMLTGGSQRQEVLEPIDVGAITDQYRPNIPMRPLLGQGSSYDGTEGGTELITVGGESSRPTGPAPTQADLKAFDTADSLGLGDTLDEIMAANPGITGEEAFRLSMASSTSGVAMKPDVFEKVMAADDPIHYLNTYHPEYASALGVDHRVSDIIGAQGTGNVNTNIGPGVNSPPHAIIGDPAATPQQPPQLPGSTTDSSGVEFNRPEDGYVPRDPDSLGGPLFEPDMPELPDFDAPDIGDLDRMDNTFTPDRFEPQWKLPDEEVKKITRDILGGGGNLASSVSDALEGALRDAPEIVKEAAESIVGDIGDNIGDIDLSPIGDLSLPQREQVVDGIKVALGTVGASMDAIDTEVNLGNGDVSEVSLEDAILGQGPTGPQGGSPSGPSGAPGGSVGAPSGTPGQPPTPNSNLPQGVAWEPNGTGGWNIRNSNTGEVFTQQEFAEAIYGNLVNGTGTTGGTGGQGTTGTGTGETGNVAGLPGGGDLGTGIDNTNLGGMGSTGTGGTGGGTGGGNGSGDGPGDGSGEGSRTPLADGLMGMLGGGTSIPSGLVDIPQVAPIQTRPLDWSFLRKVSEGRG